MFGKPATSGTPRIKRAAESNAPPARSRERTGGQWTFLSNHAHVLVCVARDPDHRLRDVAALVGITERGVAKIVAELEHAGVIRRTRSGRRNHYDIDLEAPLRHPLESGCSVGELLSTLLEPEHARRLGLTVRGKSKRAGARL